MLKKKEKDNECSREWLMNTDPDFKWFKAIVWGFVDKDAYSLKRCGECRARSG